MKINRTRHLAVRNTLAAALLLTLFACGGSGGGDSTEPGPTITLQPHSVSVGAGSAAQLTTTAVGGTITFQWYKDGTPVGGATSNIYNVATAASTDIGSYYAVATNAAGGVATDVVTIMVTGNGGGVVTVK